MDLSRPSLNAADPATTTISSDAPQAMHNARVSTIPSSSTWSTYVLLPVTKSRNLAVCRQRVSPYFDHSSGVQSTRSFCTLL